jgi:hypothetical protein
MDGNTEFSMQSVFFSLLREESLVETSMRCLKDDDDLGLTHKSIGIFLIAVLYILYISTDRSMDSLLPKIWQFFFIKNENGIDGGGLLCIYTR